MEKTLLSDTPHALAWPVIAHLLAAGALGRSVARLAQRGRRLAIRCRRSGLGLCGGLCRLRYILCCRRGRLGLLLLRTAASPRSRLGLRSRLHNIVLLRILQALWDSQGMTG